MAIPPTPGRPQLALYHTRVITVTEAYAKLDIAQVSLQVRSLRVGGFA
jgi:hypothetical protein